MKRIMLHASLVFSTLAFSTNSFAQCGQLVWSDEFDGASIDGSKWLHQTGGGGWGNNELQTYTNSQTNSRIENGRLIIEARNDGGNYTSARLTTQGIHSWQYGRFECRAKLPAGTGLWPAFWMLRTDNAWPMTGEIDIMENRGDQQSHIGGALHYGDPWPNNRSDGTGYSLPTGNFTDAFHTFALEWSAGELRWYVDDVLYKTETSNPNTLNPPSNNDPWPWDGGQYFLILNLAVGGPNTLYTGQQNPNFGTSGIMEVEFVRIYNASIPNVDISGDVRVFEQDLETYSVPNNANETYSWSFPSDATIVTGQGTNQITIDWSGSNGGDIEVDITHNAGAQCPGSTFTYSKNIEVYQKTCEFNFNNFEGAATMNVGFQSGALLEVPNPGGNAVNSSDGVGQYTRNGSEQWDALIYNDALLDNGTEYAAGTYVLEMDVRTNAPIGTQIDIQVGNQAANTGWPNGTHSIYAGTTSVQNQWETITFAYTSSPDPGGGAYQDNLDRIAILFNPGSFTNHVYYFDNIRRRVVPTPATLSVSGNQAVPNNATGESYTASGGNPGGTYQWTVPLGATIASGSNTNSITVDYASQGGKLTVSELVSAGCWSNPTDYFISVGGGGCALFNEEFDDGTVNWTTTNGAAGFTYAEINDEFNIGSTGHDEWASISYQINDGVSTSMVDFTNPNNNQIVTIRARATDTCFLRLTLVDDSGKVAQNQWLNPLNGMVITSEWQEFSIDFSGQLWDEWGGGGALDEVNIAEIRLTINGGFFSFPITNPFGGTFGSFVGDMFIDYIKIGDDCPIPIADFTANETNPCTSQTVTFTDATGNVGLVTSWQWDFGSGASPATATGPGPHNVTYGTTGLKTVSLDVNNGTSVQTKNDYIDVKTSGCITGTADVLDGFEMYPNPTSGQLNLKVQGSASVIITTLTGLAVQQAEINSIGTIELNEKPGIYIVEITSNARVLRKRLVKR